MNNRKAMGRRIESAIGPMATQRCGEVGCGVVYFRPQCGQARSTGQRPRQKLLDGHSGQPRRPEGDPRADHAASSWALHRLSVGPHLLRQLARVPVTLCQKAEGSAHVLLLRRSQVGRPPRLIRRPVDPPLRSLRQHRHGGQLGAEPLAWGASFQTDQYPGAGYAISTRTTRSTKPAACARAYSSSIASRTSPGGSSVSALAYIAR